MSPSGYGHREAPGQTPPTLCHIQETAPPLVAVIPKKMFGSSAGVE